MEEHRRNPLAATARALIPALAITALSVTGAAAAAPDWYGGAGVGLTKARDDFTGINVVDDDEDMAWKLFGGYRFHPNATVELSYWDLGEYTGKAVGLTDKFSATGFNMSLVGLFPVGNDIAVLGRVGAMLWDVDDKVTLLGTESKTGVDPSFGLGAQFAFAQNMAARIEWERFNNVGDKDKTGETKIDVLSASLVFIMR